MFLFYACVSFFLSATSTTASSPTLSSSYWPPTKLFHSLLPPFLHQQHQPPPYSPLICLTLPSSLLFNEQKTVHQSLLQQLQKECNNINIPILELDILKDPAAEAIWTLLNNNNNNAALQPPLLYHRESKQMISLSNSSADKTTVSIEKLRAWAKGRIIS